MGNCCEKSKDGEGERKAFDPVEALNKGCKGHDGAIKLYDEWADTYDETLKGWGYEAPDKVAAFFKKHMSDDVTDPRVIDQGCGTGLSGEAIKKLFPDAILTGTDCSGDSIKLLHDKKPGLYANTYVVNLDMLYKHQSATGIDTIADHSFDGCICVGVTSYIINFENCIAEWIRIVKPGGIITFTHRTKLYDDEAARQSPREGSHKSAKSVYESFEESGMWTLLEKTEPMPYTPQNPLPDEAEKLIYYITYQVN
eukprot:gnl/MRDRNA2_/MRDRNA2_233996_c0_seq1.p1 gnl/MRDRNA2_/MRDRNA2_233996_c0~~gnl/MRDRNA2_/MRDRNA2_233996_c0_seq1.p1  ORF type:complete len:254 (-),score=59.11 gnl/MRDRNA2_/MRDRNA2_233996_c0_seq1:96-857(-)